MLGFCWRFCSWCLFKGLLISIVTKSLVSKFLKKFVGDGNKTGCLERGERFYNLFIVFMIDVRREIESLHKLLWDHFLLSTFISNYEKLPCNLPLSTRTTQGSKRTIMTEGDSTLERVRVDRLCLHLCGPNLIIYTDCRL